MNKMKAMSYQEFMSRTFFEVNKVNVTAKLPASVWRALAQSEAITEGDATTSAAAVSDGNADVMVFTMPKYRRMIHYIRTIEDQLHTLQQAQQGEETQP